MFWLLIVLIQLGIGEWDSFQFHDETQHPIHLHSECLHQAATNATRVTADLLIANYSWVAEAFYGIMSWFDWLVQERRNPRGLIQYKDRLSQVWGLKIRWSQDRLIFNMVIPILVRRHLCIETAPSALAMDLCLSCTNPLVWRQFMYYWPSSWGFPSQRSGNVQLWHFFVCSQNKLLNKQWSLRCFEITWCSCDQCWKLSQKSCRSSWLESQIVNIKLKKNQQKVSGPPPKLSASDWRACGNFQHCMWHYCKAWLNIS